MNNKKIFVFDFDGTLIRSNEIKYKALYETLKNNPIIKKLIDVENFCDEFIRKSGISREIKIKNKFKNILSEKSINKIILDYSSNVDRLSKKLKISKEVTNALKMFQKKGEVYILSGGKVNEITMICQNSKSLDYINGIICTQSGKAKFLKGLKILGKVVFFGDSEIDYKASINSDTDFVRITGYSNLIIENFKGENLTSISEYNFL